MKNNTNSILQTLTHTESEELSKALSFFGKDKGAWVKTRCAVLKENRVSFSRLIERLVKIEALGRDSSSKKSYLYRYGLIEGTKLFNHKRNKCKHIRAEYEEKFGKEAADARFSTLGASLDNYIVRYGPVEGVIRWESYKAKRAKTYQAKRESGHEYPKYNLDYFVKLYGVEVGTKTYNDKIEKQRHKVSKQRYIDEYGEYLGSLICKEIKDNNSLEYYVSMYGELDGLEKYVARHEKSHITVYDRLKRDYPNDYEEKYQEYLNTRFIPNIVGYIEKFGCAGVDLYNASRPGTPSRNSISKISQELFSSIKKVIPDLFYFGKNELVIKMTSDEYHAHRRTIIRPDCTYKNKIVEFNGDAFHANPKIYNPEDYPHPYLTNLTAKEIQEADKTRQQLLEVRGYSVLVVWHSDYLKNKQSTLMECVKWLMS